MAQEDRTSAATPPARQAHAPISAPKDPATIESQNPGAIAVPDETTRGARRSKAAASVVAAASARPPPTGAGRVLCSWFMLPGA